jgi:DNA-binding NarL/FixJ family response regulator
MKVFIADDSALMRERLAAMLSELPDLDIVGQAGNGIDAITSIRTLLPDAVILDIRMPKKSGIEVLKEIKKKEPAPLVIMFTNYPYPQYRDRCLHAGADYFFDKANEVEQLLQVLNALIHKTSATTEGEILCNHAQ